MIKNTFFGLLFLFQGTQPPGTYDRILACDSTGKCQLVPMTMTTDYNKLTNAPKFNGPFITSTVDTNGQTTVGIDPTYVSVIARTGLPFGACQVDMGNNQLVSYSTGALFLRTDRVLICVPDGTTKIWATLPVMKGN